MSLKSTAKTLGFGIAAFLLFAILLTVEILNQPPSFLGRIKQQLTAAFRDPATQWLILAALAGYFILFCVLEHRLSPPGKWWRLGNANLWLSGMVALAFLRYTLSNQNTYAFGEFSILLAGIVFGKSVSTLVRWRSDRLSQNAAWLAGPLVCLLAGAALCLPGWGSGSGMIYHYHDVVRWNGIWRNPNHYGLMMGAGLVLATGIGVRAWRVNNRKRRKILCVVLCSIGAVLCGFGAFKSYSRGAWLGALAGLVYLAVRAGKSSPLFVWLRRNRLALVLLIASLTLLTFWQFRFSEWPPAQRVFSVANINDFSWRNRVTSWEWAVRTMLGHPLAGLGWRVPATIQPYNSPQQLNPAQAVVTNDFLVLGTSAGVPALLCFVAYLALSFRAKFTAPGAPLSVFTICRGGAVVFLVGFWLDGGLFFLAVTLVFWMLMELSRLEPAEIITDDAKSEPENEPKILGAVNRSKGETWLRRTALTLTAIASLQSAVYVATPFFPVNQLTLAIGRKCLIPATERDDFDYLAYAKTKHEPETKEAATAQRRLASYPIWTGRKLRVLLEHVDLANYNRRLVNWKVDDSMYRDYVLTTVIRPESDGQFRWRRPLWEFFYPGIRRQNHEQDAAKVVLQQLRRAVAVSSNAPSTIDEMWRLKSADAKGFEALCVAAFRSVGIPARLASAEPKHEDINDAAATAQRRLGGDGWAEFFDGKVWQSVSSIAK